MSETQTPPVNDTGIEQHHYTVHVDFESAHDHPEQFEMLFDHPLLGTWQSAEPEQYGVSVHTVGTDKTDASDRAIALTRHLLGAAGISYKGILTTAEIERS